MSKEEKLMIADAQTSGGLLVAMPEEVADEYAKKCTEETGLNAKQIGVLTTSKKNRIIIN